MRTVEGTLGGPAIEVVAEVTRRRFTVEYKRKIVREPDSLVRSDASWSARPSGLPTRAPSRSLPSIVAQPSRL